ncbi:hybrid signal transduction histidine kinase L-like [Zerene cesonia]|uniref:hybrid signal transduction histidine kinase L-like n=1 Tax=Zerene cesonia TaxID=33412 RepID=UPI0018E50B07|nr:hybrid signal transduction histidine kinase L-like [Zerene cesonia]
MAGTKFYGSTSTFLLSVAAFISLSVYIHADDSRQCYWCGPLAEQVHRSRRAPPCDAPKAHVTSCDPGLLHCAVVATAPPYVESRYCVKIYQDECYVDFCNSTKTWKMTCPCKGDLCNGQNSDREDKAFAELIEKTQKQVKKRTRKSISESFETPIEIEENMHSSYPSLSAIEIKQNETNRDNINEKNFVTHIKIVNVSEERESLVENDSEEPVTSQNLENNNDPNDKNETEKTTLQINDEISENSDNNNHIETTPMTLESTIKITELNKVDNPLPDNLIKPSEELPTAEALQESVKPNTVKDKQNFPTTLSEDSTVTTTEGIEITTEKANQKSGSERFKLSTYLLIAVLNFF